MHYLEKREQLNDDIAQFINHHAAQPQGQQMTIKHIAAPKHTGDTPKEVRYDWPEIRGAPPRVKMIHKRELANKDDSYQREENAAPLTAHQLRIAKSFNWRSFGAIVCAERNGKLLVVDGQNRLMAALRRDDITIVPVVIIDTTGSNEQKRSEEARAFLELNGDRKLVSANQRFIAGCVAKDASSLAVQRVCEGSGVSICVGGKKVGTTASVDLLRKLIERRGEASVVATLVRCRELSESSAVSSRLISAIDYLTSGVFNGRPLDDQFWEILARFPQAAIDRAMGANCILTGLSGPRILANGIITLVNSKCRKRYGMA